MIQTFFVWDYLKISRWPSGMINILVCSSVFYNSFPSEFWRYFSIILRSFLLLVFTHFHKVCLSLEAHRIFVPDIFWYFTVIYYTLVWVCFHPLVLALWNFLNLGRGPFSPFYFFGIIICVFTLTLGFPDGAAGKESACNVGDLDSVPEMGRSPGEGKRYPLQYSGLENPMDWIVHGVGDATEAT